MSKTDFTPTPPGTLGSRWFARALKHPVTYVLMGGGILLLDLLTGPFLQFPILFVLPVSLAAWFYSTRWAYALAMLLPLGRFLFAAYVGASFPLIYTAANAITRVAVLGFFAFLVGRTARQTKALQDKVAGFVRICAWSRTVEYQGEWISFEEYLERRFNIVSSHGISPAELEKAFRDRT